MIQELFSGRVAEFLKYDMLFLGKELKEKLQQGDRLSELDKQVICCIGNEIQPVAIYQILEICNYRHRNYSMCCNLGEIEH